MLKTGVFISVHKKLIIFILAALSLVALVVLKTYYTDTRVETTTEVQQQANSAQPYIDFVDKTFASYSSGNTSGISEGALEGLGDSVTGIKSFPKEYFTSNFKVLNTRNGLAGGKEMNIRFEDKPDKVFWVWVYKLATGDYEIRGFQENTKYSEIQSTN